MTPEVFQRALILTGPTGSGKTQLGIELAERLNAEIISMDSMALYRGMDIGTAKPTAQERRRVPHHLLDIFDPWESASVAAWLERAAVCCQEIEARGKLVIFVGGTPLYLQALLHGLFDGPPADIDIRRQLTAEAERLGGAALHGRLAQVDPSTAARIHPHDIRRVIRALEVWELTGRPISEWQQQWKPQPNRPSHEFKAADGGPFLNILSSFPILKSGPWTMDFQDGRSRWLNWPRADLYARINARVRLMIEQGLVDEALALRRLPRPLSSEAAQAVGYKEVFAYIDGQATLEDTVQKIQTRSRQFAKRQLTWFRHMPACRPLTPELTFPPERLTMKQEKNE